MLGIPWRVLSLKIMEPDYIFKRSLTAVWRIGHEGWGSTRAMAGSPVKIQLAR